jgi:uncharacterized membrane protein YbhN (UPF0104 family)
VTTHAARLRRLAPWLAAALLLGVVFLRVDFAATARALARADWPRFVLAALPFAGVWLAIDAAALSRLVTRFHAPVRFPAMLRLRGGTYLFLVLSYDAAQAALALALSRRLRVPLLALGGTFLLYYALDLLTIAGLGSLGALALPGARGAALRPALAGLLALVATALAAGVWLARRPHERRPRWLAGARILETLRAARLRDVAEWTLWRALFYGSFVAFAAATLPAFGIHVPLPALLACVPVTLSLAALPITVSGLGSAQVAMLALYGAFADEASIVAYSLAHSVSLIALRLPIGLACWPALASAVAPASETQLVERSPS